MEHSLLRFFASVVVATCLGCSAGDGSVGLDGAGDADPWDVRDPGDGVDGRGDFEGGGDQRSVDVSDQWLDGVNELVIEPACLSGAECQSGLCVTWAGGGRCSVGCEAGCGPDEECRVVSGVAGAETGVCVPRFFSQCAPCKHSSDCKVMLALNGVEAGSGAGCFSLGDSGSYCGANCQLAGCPEGYVCEEVALAGGGAGNYCVPESGQCLCEAYAGEAGKETVCLNKNEHGSCEGKRKCTGTNGVWELSECQGPEPLPEACNNEDDDCDGLVDEGWSGVSCEVTGEFGTCKGMQTCVAGEVVCSAEVPEAEICDGLDNNCDGQVDEKGAAGCQEYFYDSDGDGVGLGIIECWCAPEPPFSALVEGDCNDYEETIFPGADESCDSIDNNCNLSVDEGCDDDEDGWCDGSMGFAGTPQACPLGAGDCDDGASGVFPGQGEVCDGQDNGCYGGADVGCDVDGDGWCAEEMVVIPGKALCVLGSGDCDDGNAGINPGNGTCETCSVGQKQVVTTGCGECQGKVRECVAEDEWGPYSECQSLCAAGEFCVYGQCKPCVLGMKEITGEGCESCFERKRTCGSNGEWLNWGSCQALCVEGESCFEGVCVECIPGTAPEVDSMGCAPVNCQKRTRSCLETGTWSDWSACGSYCAEGLVCYQNVCVECRPTDPAQTSTEGCDSCSSRQRYCNGATLKWGAWSECLTKCTPGKICDSGVCKECVPYTEQQVPCGCGYSTRYCLPEGIWGPYSDCETFCAVGFTCDQGKDCYVTQVPTHAYEGQAFCGYGFEEGSQVTVYCQAGQFCAEGLCRMYQYQNAGTQYTPYPNAGGGGCGIINPDGVPIQVFCQPGHTCVGTYCVR